MSEGYPKTPEYRTLEITVPVGSESYSALRGLATALNLPTRDREALTTEIDNSNDPEAWRISLDDIRDIALQNFGEEDYANSAAAWLEDVKSYTTIEVRDTGSYLGVYDSRESTKGKSIDGVPLGQPENILLRSKIPEETQKKIALTLWSMKELPFAPEIHINEEDSLIVQPGQITRERLANYLRINQLDKHDLRGSMGKMFSILGIAAGVTNESTLEQCQFEGDFVDALELNRILDESGLSSREISAIRKKMYLAGHYQLKTGQPHKSGELVLEGGFEEATGLRLNFDKVAVRSLVSIGHSYRNKSSPAAKALMSFGDK